jgi:hypothetical protein
VRDVPEEAVRVLREFGFIVEERDPPPDASQKALRNW